MRLASASSEEELLPISALQHLLFCPRQCALIHVAQEWSENALTVEGRILHQRVDSCGHETRNGIRTEFGVRIRSLTYGIVGIADAVEFTATSHADVPATPRPVEYKHGHAKPDSCDEVQLCAQAFCLEEMCGVCIPSGVLYYGAERTRHPIALDEPLRQLTRASIVNLRELLSSRVLPRAEYTPKCRSCSLADACMPKLISAVSKYVHDAYNALEAPCENS